ncbi:TadE/TadG family type IV pilus assembly protein [Bryobacter aggregatus]|uniref:TadE/TadG family type IV pilus assembly protein n=1 Tax=Bryobacter aggregatus TaxID=360054 RepID=UPI0004E16845|nr:TadE/TadG family type IV pilus assembly protein [Bryobacter aggregatus]
MKQAVNPKRRRGRRGNTLIEFSLCALPLFALFFGVSDIALAVFLKSMLQSAVRDGVRFGITFQTTLNGTSCGTQTACIKQVVQNASIGFLSGTANSNLISVKYYQPTDLTNPLTPGDVGVGKTIKNDTYSPARSLMYMNQTGNLIEVSVTDFPWNWMVPLPNFMPGTQIKMSSSASDVLQGYPVGASAPPAP